MSSIKKNFFYSAILTSANYIFPLLTYPYVSRVLGVENIGIVNFIDSIINYFILFSSMGLATVGIREIAKAHDDKARLQTAFSSLISLTSATTLVFLIILAIATFTVPELNANKEIMGLGAIKLVFNLFLIEWFYQGFEDFKYITIRTLIVKTLYVLGVFIFVRDKNDFALYYLLTVLMIVVNAIINFIHSFGFVTFSLRHLSIRKYVRPFFTLGLYKIMTSMYTTFNIAYLGFICGTIQVGYYTTATKLFSIILAIFTAFTGVMLPRMSSLIAQNKIEEFKQKVNQSIDILITITVPGIIFSIINAPQIVLLISGKGYEGAIIPMMIVMPLLFIIGYEQVLVIQTLMPLAKDKIITRNSIIGALIGLILNIATVPFLQSIGSAIVWICSELAIMILSQKAVRNSIGIDFPTKTILSEIIAYIPLVVMSIFFHMFISNIWLSLVTNTLILILYFFGYNLLVKKQSFIRSLIQRKPYIAPFKNN